MTKRKIAIAIAAAALAGTCAIGGTLAWLTATDEVTNTFTVGNVDLSISEPAVASAASDALKDYITPKDDGDGYNYKLIPGKIFPKDPTITVEQGSESCYVFAEITDTTNPKLIYAVDTENWEAVEGHDGVYVYKKVVSAEEAADGATLPPVFKTIELSSTFEGGTVEGDIKVTASAIQSEGFDNADAAYDALIEANN